MKKLFESTVNNPHPHFVALRDKPHNERLREILEEFWLQYRPFADKNFLSAFACDPHPRFWEMSLACGLLNLGFKLLPARDRGEAGPDLCLLDDDKRIWIEAVAPGSGTGPDLLNEPPTGKAYLVPEDQIVLRLCSGMIDKRRKLHDYLEKGTISEQDAFVIALGSAALPHELLNNDVPYPVQAVYPVGKCKVLIDPRSMSVVSTHLERRETIKKRSGAEVPTNAFLCQEFSKVSGLIFSNARISRLNSRPEEELSYIHNYTATNALPCEWLRNGEEWRWESGGEMMRSHIGNKA